MTERYCTPLRQIANQVPLGFECRSCGASAYNWIAKIDRYAQTGEPCCADFSSWCQKADAAKEAERAEKTAHLSATLPPQD